MSKEILKLEIGYDKRNGLSGLISLELSDDKELFIEAMHPVEGEYYLLKKLEERMTAEKITKIIKKTHGGSLVSYNFRISIYQNGIPICQETIKTPDYKPKHGCTAFVNIEIEDKEFLSMLDPHQKIVKVRKIDGILCNAYGAPIANPEKYRLITDPELITTKSDE